MRALLVVVVLGACGRVGFDDGGGDASATGSSGISGGETCATARQIAIGTMLTDESIAGAADDHPAPLCGGGPDVVYAFDQPAMVLRTISVEPTFRGTFWHSTECPPVPGSCTSVGANGRFDSQVTFPPGTVYLVIDKIGGTGTTYTLSLQ